MRFKHILLLIVCICLMTIIYCILIADPRSAKTLDSINKQLRHLKGVVIRRSDQTIHHSINNIFIFNNNHNYNAINGQQSVDNNDVIDGPDSERRCRQYLQVLGLWTNSTADTADETAKTLLSNEQMANTWPVFVTAVAPDSVDVAKGFLRSYQQEFAANTNQSLIVYDLGLNRRQLLSISSICNESQPQNHTRSSDTTPSLRPNASTGRHQSAMSWCTIRRFDYDLFPGHVSDLKLRAYRPLILQLVLREWGAAVWLDPDHYVLPGAAQKARNVTARARREGLLSWTIDQPTSSLTHPKMFDYFRTNQNQYYFHRMVRPAHIVLYNTGRVHQQVMLPWVKCALTVECLSPIGSQASGCRFDKKPLYRYSGCHHYDTSALNVVLGLVFDFNERPYVAAEDDKFWRVVTADEIENYTESGDDITSDSDYTVASAPATPGVYHRPRPVAVGGRNALNNSL